MFRPATCAELHEAIEQAFDYRGDVTLELKSGRIVEGYVSNRDRFAPEPFLEMYPKGDAEMQRIPYSEIISVAFTGRDTASGKSWEAWVAKKEAQRRAEADLAAAEARARGHL